MKFVYFSHSLVSCWNHGNAHFLRGILRELQRAGHEVAVLEPADSWSRQNLLAEQPQAVLAFAATFPSLVPCVAIVSAPEEIEAALQGADVVIMHEWNAPALATQLGRLRAQNRFTLLFHDTHHRMVSEPDAMSRYDLSGFDGILAFGETLSEAYRRQGWGQRVFTWHEAADLELFHPPEHPLARHGAVWIGNWGDGERSAELRDYMLAPVAALDIPLSIYGVRYPEEALAALAAHGACYHGWLPNARAPKIFAQHLFTLHVPRRFYVSHLPGIPTIRVFEALACGIPLLSAPWQDSEHLFTPGEDFLMAQTPDEMQRLMRALHNDAALRAQLAAHGLATIRARHSCAHRAEELLGIIGTLRGATGREAA